jgi:23S rRNA (cytidine2498-2'-O)-methyltransferase
LIEALATHSGPWRLHVFSVYRRGGPVGPRRCQLIAEQIEGLLRKKQRRLLRTQQPAAGPWLAGEALVQIGLLDAANGFVSVCLPPLRERLRRMVVPFPGGVVPIGPDRRAPSRAFAKLLEAEIRLGRRITAGETCVDLGSSPGSWAHLAVHRGARVVAVDRSPLRADLMAHPALDYRRGDAFRFEPSEPVDWLLCDVIAAPRRSSELLQRWLEKRWCRHFVVTIKLHGAGEDQELEPLKAWLTQSGVEFQIRRLTNNKNEVTAVGRLSEPSVSSAK